ncbi:hypothetical protein Tco_0890443 [Tanacetum coccineum]|uniref:Pre-mRNA splicing Prp18-interacting factor n=1 Tax=Tanacetum coccineum TaxID=301880 RepID=A0ABQ5C3F5_9ASTR
MSSFTPRCCFKCGGPFGGLHCRQCTCDRCRRKFMDEVCSLCCGEDGKLFDNCPNPTHFKYFYNSLQQPQTHSAKSFNDNPNFGYTPQEPFVYNQDPSEIFSQSPPQIDQRYCYGCGDPLDDLFCQWCTCELCGNDAHYGYDYPPQVPFVYDQDLFDQFQPSQFLVIHQPPQEMSIQDMEDLKQQYLDEMKSLINEIQIKDYRNEKIDIEIKINELKENFNGMSIEINKKKKLQQLEQEFSIPMSEIYKSSLTAITPNSPITDSLIMEDEHLDTISETKSDEEYESSVEDLNLTPSESEDLSKDLSDIESECDVPICDDFTTSSNPLFDSYDDSTSSDDESFSDEDVPKENFKIYSNPLFDEEIISTKIDPYHFNAESDLIESLLNRDTSIIFSPKFDSLLEEFSGELAYIDLISTEIDKADFDLEEEIYLVEKLLYDNSSPRPPDSLMKEIDIFLTPDDSMPPGMENDDYDSERDILFLEELFSNDSPSLPENESFHFDVPSSPRPPAKPPDDGIYFEPDTGLLTAKVVGDISKHYVLIPRLLPPNPPFVQIAPDYEDPRARGFVHRSLDLQSMLLGI